MYKNCKVIMLATDKADNALILYKGPTSKVLRYEETYLTQSYLHNVHAESYHLYIISDDKIKEGNWVNHGIVNLVYQVNTDNIKASIYNQSKKIIATTDSFLTKCIGKDKCGKKLSEIHVSYPQISLDFIQQYVTEYNKSNIITDIMVEYEGKQVEVETGYLVVHLPKINEDRIINIKLIKDSWSKEEVESLFISAFNAGESWGINKTREPDYYMYQDSPLKELLNKFKNEN